MDASRLAVTFAVLLIGIVVGRFVVNTAGRAGDGVATLFVPPDLTLGWPRGVQESDEPWGWHQPAAAPTEVLDAADGGAGPDDRGDPPPTGSPTAGRFVVDPAPVAPITFRARLH